MAFNLTLNKKKALSEFQRILKNEIPAEMNNDTILLTKFLKARDFDIRKAESMIKKNVIWRKQMQIDTILTDFQPPEVLTKYLSYKIFGFDKEGHPVCYVQIGKVDVKGLMKSSNKINISKVFFQEMETHTQLQRSQSKKLGKPILRSTGIWDAKDLSLTQIRHTEAIQFLLTLIMSVQDNYPEFLEKIFLINASSAFRKIWSVVEKCLAVEVKKKISVHGQDGWKEELLKKIDADTLPSFLGGNRTDPDGNPLCLNIVNHLCGPIPEKYFPEKDVTIFSRREGVKSVTINRQEKISVPIQVTASNSVIHWEFLLANYNIGFGISLERADGSTEEVIPVHKIETEVEPYIDSYRCKNLGKHMIVFDNSYSWFHNKEVYYRIWITNAVIV